jgi:hypothetical protein
VQNGANRRLCLAGQDKVAPKEKFFTPFGFSSGKFLRQTNAFEKSLLLGQDACDRNPRRPWEPPCGSNAA